ncbi:MAG: enoyl-CoA hydratase/isomerase family protein [Burkholderiales bacterium]|nr:enoyl-CoA hydratase/isomerase family protein [Burkholderiales bacterium]
MTDEILYGVSERVARLSLNRPERRNALTQAGLDALAARIDEAGADAEVWVIAIAALGEDFCIGQDLADLSRKDRSGDFFAPVLRALDRAAKPVVCAARGELRGGGAGVLLGSDIRILGRSARIGWLHARMGIASISGPATLARVLPKNIAYEMMFTCDYLDAERAYALGLANHVVADDALAAKQTEVVAKILANAPLATRAMKHATQSTLELPYDEAVARARAILEGLIGSEDAKEGLRAMREGRTPHWTGR